MLVSMDYKERDRHSKLLTLTIFTILILPIHSATDIKDYYVGCYPYEPSLILSRPLQSSQQATNEQCRIDCAEYVFSGILHGKYCYCFNELSDRSLYPGDVETNGIYICDKICEADEFSMCGGVRALSVHRAKVSAASVGLLITVTNEFNETDPFSQVAWVPTEFQINGFNDSVNTVEYNLDFENNFPSVKQSGDPVFEKTVLFPHRQYEVSGKAIDEEGTEVITTLLLESYLEVMDVSIDCPSVFAAEEELFCYINAIGSNLSVAVDFGDSDFRSQKFGDTFVRTTGTLNNQDKALAYPPTASRVYIQFNKRIQDDGILIGWRFQQKVAGKVTFQVYRPGCSDGLLYCYYLDTCMESLDSCNRTAGPQLTSSCTHTFSLDERQCVSDQGVDTSDNYRYWADLGTQIYNYVGETDVDTDILDFNEVFTTLENRIYVRKGDVLAVYLSGAGRPTWFKTGFGTKYPTTYYVDPGTEHNNRNTNGYKLLNLPGTPADYDFLLEAVVAQTSTLAVAKTYAEIIDEVNVTVKVSSSYSEGMKASNYIDLQIKVSDVVLTSSPCGTTGYVQQFEILPHPGEVPTYRIDFGDGTVEETKDMYINHTYDESGVYDVLLYTFNNVSYFHSNTSVKIQDDILNLQLSDNYHITALGNLSRLFMEIDQGTNVTYSISINDGTDNVFFLYHDLYDNTTDGEHLGLSAYLNYTFHAPGNWSMIVVVTNCISRAQATHWFKVEIPIVGLDIIPIDPVAYGDSAVIYFTITNGTDVTFWSKFDGNNTRDWVMHEIGIEGHQFDKTDLLKAALSYQDRRESAVQQYDSATTDNPLNKLKEEQQALIDALNVNLTLVKDQAIIRHARHVDGYTYHHGMAFITPDDYLVTGPHVLEIFGENIVQETFVNASFTMWVEYIIENLTMQANTTYVKPFDPVLFNITVDQASRVTHNLTYDDGYGDSIYLYDHSPLEVLEYAHHWAEAGNYSVELFSENAVSNDSQLINITVQNAVEGVHYFTNSPVTRSWSRPALAEFYIYWNPDESLFPTDAMMTITFGNSARASKSISFEVDSILHNITVEKSLQDDEDLERYENRLMVVAGDDDITVVHENLTSILAFESLTTFEYPEYGDYNITVNISNYVSYKYWESVVVVDQEVVELEINSDVYAVTYNDTVTLSIKMIWGSRINLTWDFDDSESDEYAVYDRNGDNVKTHLCDETGAFYPTIFAENSVGNWTAVVPQPIIVQGPVQGFIIVCDLEKFLLEDPNWLKYVESHLYLDKYVPMATNATAVLNLGIGASDLTFDMNVLWENRDPSKDTDDYYHVLTIGHNYTRGGTNNITVEITNLVSTVVYDTSVDIYEDIFNLTVVSRSAHTAEEAENIDNRMIGYGDFEDKFPLDHFVVMQVAMVRGSFINYTYDWGDGTVDWVFDQDYHTHQYAELGHYTVNINASNPLSSVYRNVELAMQVGVGSVCLYTHTPLSRNTTNEVQIDPGYVGTDACYYIDFGIQSQDGDPINPVMFIGNQQTCNRNFASVMADEPNFRADYGFNETASRQLLKDFGNANFTVDMNWMSVGIYTAGIIAINEVSSASCELSIGITRGPCQWPEVAVASENGCQTEAMCLQWSGMRIKKHYRSEQLSIKSFVKVNCTSTKISHYTWQICKVNEESGDLGYCYTDGELFDNFDEPIILYDTRSISEIVVKGNTFEYGLYWTNLNVSMDGEIGIETNDTGYFYITKTPLKPALDGGAAKRKGWGTNVTFNALLSLDPDFPDDKEFSCKWLCRRMNCSDIDEHPIRHETYPTYDEKYEVETREFQTTCEYPNPADIGGCFIDNTNSSGYFDIRPESIQDDTGCHFIHDFYYAYEMETIEFKLVIEKDTRKAEMIGYIEIAKGDPPEIDIESNRACLSNCKEKVNYASKYTVQAVVTNGRAGTVYNYEWDLIEVDRVGEDVNPFEGHQFENYERFLEYASTGTTRQAITIEKDFFTADDATRTYYLYVKAWRAIGDASNYGFAYRKFEVNTPPAAGECIVVPDNGTALVTMYNVECPTAFTDVHKPFTYEVSTQGGGFFDPDNPSTWTQVSWDYFHQGESVKSREGGLVPQGDERDGYILWLRVRCLDAIGSWTDIYINTTVYPAPIWKVIEMAESLKSGNSDEMFDNPQVAANVNAALFKTMNNAISNYTDMCLDYVQGPDEIDDAFVARLIHCEEEKADLMLAETLERMQTRDAAADKFKKVVCKTPEACTQKLSALNQIGGNPSEMSGQAQEDMKTQTADTVNVLANSGGTLDSQAAEKFAGDVVKVSGNTVQASALSTEDEQKDEEALAQQTVAGQISARRRKRSTGTAEDLQAETLELVGKVGEILGNSKAAGESPSLISTPLMSLAVSSNYGDSASKVTADEGNGFELPSSDDLFPGNNDTSQVIMQSNVISQSDNPFIETNSSSDALKINSAVVMLSLSNGTGAAMDLGNMTAPTHIFIKRDAGNIQVSTLVKACPRDDDESDDTPLTIHKILVPAASSLHIRLTQTWIVNVTNCTGLNATQLNVTEGCNATSYLEATNAPTWVDVTTTRPPSVTTQLTTTTVPETTTTTTMRTTTTQLPTTTTASFMTTTEYNTSGIMSRRTTTAAPGTATGVYFDSTTESWIVEETNKTGFVLYMSVGEKFSFNRPDSYFTCDLPFLNDPVRFMQEEIEQNNISISNYMFANTTNLTIPEWIFNLPANLERDLDTCFFSNSFFKSHEETEVYMAVKYIAPVNSSHENFTEFFNSTTPTPIRNKRAASTTPMLNETEAAMIEEVLEKIFYQLEFYTAQCKVYNSYTKSWETEGCEVGPYSSPTNTHCICTKLQREPPEDWSPPPANYDPVSGEIIPPVAAPPMSFGSAFAVPTNTIDLSNSAFGNLAENPLVFSVMTAIVCLYLCTLVWARATDIKDDIKASTSPLLDNDPRDKYHYELIVYTGSASGSSTTAKVSIILSGDEDETPPRLIFDDKKPVLQSGGVDSFILSVPRPLGSLNMLRVWHDNSGKSPSWNFSRMQVTDLQTAEKFFFVVDRWLAVDRDDGQVDRVVPVAGRDELTNFNLIFWNKAKTDITDGHIWFSIIGRPARSRFTRVQRLTCCLSLLFCTMATNIFFFQPADESSGNLIRLGPIEFTLTQLLTGVYAGLMVFPINILIVMIFRYSAQRKKHLSKAVKAKKKQDEFASISTLELREQEEYLQTGNDINRVMANLETTMVDDWRDISKDAKDKKTKKGQFSLPWWFIYVAYFLCFASVGVCYWYTIEQAGAFGKSKAAQWLVTFATSFFESVFFSQPIKVLGLAAFYALVIKSPATEDNDERDPDLQKDEVYIHQHHRAKDMNNPQFRKRIRHYTKIPLPPSEEYLRAARLLRNKEVKMMDILKEMALYVIFIYLLLMVSYGNRDPNAHRLYQNVENMMGKGHLSTRMSINKVRDYGTMYRWIEDTLIGSYYSTPLYDGRRHWWTTNFSSDYQNVPVGSPRLRLLRIEDKQCSMPVYKYTRICQQSYTRQNEDTADYREGWIAVNTSDPKDKPDYGWAYNTSASIQGMITSGYQALYSGGGYVVDIGVNREKALQTVKRLKEAEWMGPETRAVIVEFNLYNAAANLFVVSYMLFEFLQTGAIDPVYKVQIFRMDRYIGSQALTVMVAEILFVCFMIYYLVREIKVIKKIKFKEYCKSKWNVFELMVLSACFGSLIVYFTRLYYCITTMQRFRADRTKFINLQVAATVDEVYGYVIAAILFAATIKFLKILRFNKRIVTLALTMIAILKPLASFFTVFIVVFMSFAHMTFLIFVTNLLEFSTFMSSVNTLISMMLNKFDYKSMQKANPQFAPYIFMAFVIVMTLILINFMLTLILDTYADIRAQLMQLPNEYEIVDFVTNKFKGLFGAAPPPDLPKIRSELEGFVDDKEGEFESRIEELMDKFMDIVVTDPSHRELSDEYEKRKKYLKSGNIKRKIFSG